MFHWYDQIKQVFQDCTAGEELAFFLSYIVISMLGVLNGLIIGVLI